MLSTLENSLKRVADDTPCHSVKRMRLINHAYDQSRGIKRRSQDDLVEPSKKSKVTSYVKGVKRKGDSIIMNPTKRVKTSHLTLRRPMLGCRPTYDANYDHDRNDGNHPILIAIVA
jgi:hypothetical protein